MSILKKIKRVFRLTFTRPEDSVKCAKCPTCRMKKGYTTEDDIEARRTMILKRDFEDSANDSVTKEKYDGR